MTLERPSGEIYAVTLTRRPLEARPAPARPHAPGRALRPPRKVAAQSCRAKLPRKVAAQCRRARLRGCGPAEGGCGPGLSGRARARSERSRRSPARESLWLRVRASRYLRRRPAALRPPISCGDASSAISCDGAAKDGGASDDGGSAAQDGGAASKDGGAGAGRACAAALCSICSDASRRSRGGHAVVTRRSRGGVRQALLAATWCWSPMTLPLRTWIARTICSARSSREIDEIDFHGSEIDFHGSD